MNSKKELNKYGNQYHADGEGEKNEGEGEPVKGYSF